MLISSISVFTTKNLQHQINSTYKTIKTTIYLLIYRNFQHWIIHTALNWLHEMSFELIHREKTYITSKINRNHLLVCSITNALDLLYMIFSRFFLLLWQDTRQMKGKKIHIRTGRGMWEWNSIGLISCASIVIASVLSKATITWTYGICTAHQ